MKRIDLVAHGLALLLAGCTADALSINHGGGNTPADASATGEDARTEQDAGFAPDAMGHPDANDPIDAGFALDAGAALPRFSFFVTSLRAVQEVSGSPDGFGGDLRFGETGPGAGLRGADKICATIAERSMPGSSVKGWRAFLSVAHDENGNQQDAIDRIGDGPWYDRLGRVFALRKADLVNTRPSSADPAIRDDFPNEDGVPNHQPDPTQPQVDNHDMLTGSNAQGRLYAATATCLDWTSADGDRAREGKPRVGHSWPRNGPGGGRPGPGGVDPAHWISSLDESGCAPGVAIVERGPPQQNEVTVGSGGGYGGFYCFALTP